MKEIIIKEEEQEVVKKKAIKIFCLVEKIILGKFKWANGDIYEGEW